MCMTVYMFTNYVHASEINTHRPTTEIRAERLTRQSPRRLCPRREVGHDFVWGTKLFRIPGIEAQGRPGARMRIVWTKGLHIF
jgi:hypothetical protein